MKIYLIGINDNKEEEDIPELLEYIDNEYRAGILRYRFLSDRKRSLYGHLLSRYAIIKERGLKNTEIKILKSEHGKPYVKEREDICYNVSHSGDHVVCVIDSLPVGIDIQEVKKADIMLAERFFSKEENDFLNLSKEDKTSLFYEMWSLKEAYIKAVGLGLRIPLDEFAVLRDKDTYSLYVKGIKNDEHFFKRYDILSDYKLSVCSKADDFAKEVKEVFIEEILQTLDSKLTV